MDMNFYEIDWHKKRAFKCLKWVWKKFLREMPEIYTHDMSYELQQRYVGEKCIVNIVVCYLFDMWSSNVTSLSIYLAHACVLFVCWNGMFFDKTKVKKHCLC